jgi:hypothetical protein
MTMANTTEKLKQYVDQYTALGLKVLPVWGIRHEGGKYICACPKGEHCDQKPGKHPLPFGRFKSGVHTATDDASALHEVIDAHPDMNIAIAVPDGMIVIDVDPRNGGDYQLDDIEAKNGKFPDTWDQLTGGGGRHLCYQVQQGMKFAGKLAPGIDIKQGGGYIMVEPSLHESGQVYGWELSSSPLDGVGIEFAPQWLISMSERPTISSVSTAMATFNVDEVAVADLRAALLHVDPDDRDTWVRVGHALKTIGDVGLDIWDQWSQRSPKYKAREIVYRWNGFAPGNITYKSVFHIAQDCGWTNAAKVRAHQERQLQAHLPAQLPRPQQIDPDTGEVLPEEPDRPLFTKVSDLLSDIKSVQWLIDNYLETDALSMVFGPSGGGKSFTVVDMACCVATGTPWHGMAVKQGAVFYIAGEGHNGLARRFKAWTKARGVEITKDTPFFKSNRAIMMLNATAASELSAEVDRLAKETGMEPVLVIVDTLARNFGDGDENKQQDANLFIEHLDEFIRRRWKCNVMTVHHSGHDMDRARGSSALKGAMDQEIWVKGQAGHIELKVTKMKDAEIPVDRRFRINQIDLGIQDECGIEITGAHLEVDGNPLEFKVGTRTNGSDITAIDVAKAMYPRWPGVPPMAATLGCSERSLSRIMKAMKDNAMADGGKGGWELSEQAINHLSMTGFLAIGGQDSAA